MVPLLVVDERLGARPDCFLLPFNTHKNLARVGEAPVERAGEGPDLGFRV